MGDVTSVCTFRVDNSVGGKRLRIDAPDTVDNGDTIVVNLADYGWTKFKGVIGFIHTTADSVLAQEQPTTSVTSGVLTLTVGGATANKQRTYFVEGA